MEFSDTELLGMDFRFSGDNTYYWVSEGAEGKKSRLF